MYVSVSDEIYHRNENNMKYNSFINKNAVFLIIDFLNDMVIPIILFIFLSMKVTQLPAV